MLFIQSLSDTKPGVIDQNKTWSKQQNEINASEIYIAMIHLEP